MWPPPIPQCPDIFPRRSFENAQVGRLEKTGHTKKQRFALVGSFAEQIQRQALRDQRKRQFVFLITERRSQFLKERLVTPMVVYLIANPRSEERRVGKECRYGWRAGHVIRCEGADL